MSQKRITMRHIAELTGVSRTTVSVVLNNNSHIAISPETRRRILAAANTLGYVPDAAAQSLVRQRAGAVALVLRQGPHQIVNDAFLSPVVHGIAAAIKEGGYHVIVEPLNSNASPYSDLVRSRRADGILLSNLRTYDDQLLRLHQANIPVVLIGQLQGTDIPFVDIDNRGAAIRAVNHLIDLGHRQIACLTNAPLSYTASIERLAGYRDALEAAGIDFDEQLVRIGDFTESSGAAAIRDLLEQGCKPTAIFAASDIVAIGALSAIQAAGLRVPEDIALVGFDNIPPARHVDPPLTTIRLPAYDLGWKAARLLTRLIEGRNEGRSTQILLDTEFIIRRSSGEALADRSNRTD